MRFFLNLNKLRILNPKRRVLCLILNNLYLYKRLYLNERPNEAREVYYMKETLEHYCQALEFGLWSKSDDWIDYLKVKSKNNLIEYIDLISSQTQRHENTHVFVEKCIRLLDLCPRHTKAHVNFKICQYYFNKSVQNIDIDYLISLRSIKECYFFYQECLRLVKLDQQVTSSTNQNEYNLDRTLIDELIDDVLRQECIAEARQQKNIADGYYDKAVNVSEQLDVDQIWNVIDLYRDAIIKAKEKDVEIEAECLSKIATIYDRVLLCKDQAKAYYYKCFELAESMKPKVSHHFCAWFIKCKAAIERFQKETVQAENEKKELEKKSVLHKIESDLTKINNQFLKKDRAEFIKFVYENYKPKNEQHTLDLKLIKENELKKALKFALIHYHPDKNTAHGLEWYFICDEISKNLSNFYELLK